MRTPLLPQLFEKLMQLSYLPRRAKSFVKPRGGPLGRRRQVEKRQHFAIGGCGIVGRVNRNLSDPALA
jgi:hypothetical protein